MASHSNGRRTHNWTRRHFRSRLQSMIQHPLGSPRTGCTSLSSDHIRSPLLSIRLCSCQVRTHTPHTVGVAPWVETVTAGGTLMVMGTAATRAVETAMPTARATVRPCSPRSHRRSSASRARTVRTRPRSDHRSTGHIQATCPQSYSPREVRRAVATLAMVTVMLAAGGTLMVLETIANRAMATVTPMAGGGHHHCRSSETHQSTARTRIGSDDRSTGRNRTTTC